MKDLDMLLTEMQHDWAQRMALLDKLLEELAKKVKQ